MSGFDAKYVVDTNSLTQLGIRRRASRFFIGNARIPSEVLNEAKGFPDIAALRRNEYPTTATVLEQVRKVMATVAVNDTTLVNLYANHGNADPFVVACALDGRDRDAQSLFATEWVVVTEDKAVRAKADEFGLRALPSTEFAALIDADEGDDRGSSTA